MEKNDIHKKHVCSLCNYATRRAYDLTRHHNAKHNKPNTHLNDYTVSTEDKTTEQIVLQNEANVPHQLMCKKCNKIYKIKKCLVAHEVKCKAVDELTCPRCMISFTTRQSKSRHIAAKKCDPRSIIYARIPNAENIKSITTHNIIINNYKSERIDYLDYDYMLEIFKGIYNIPSVLTKYIHFNKEFPENNNILSVKHDKTNSLVKIDGEFIFRNINNLIQELIKDKTMMMYNFAQNNKEIICIKMDTKIYEGIIDILLKPMLLQERSEHYKMQAGIIRDMIKNSKNI